MHACMHSNFRPTPSTGVQGDPPQDKTMEKALLVCMQSRRWGWWVRRVLGWVFGFDPELCLDLDRCFQNKKLEVRLHVATRAN